MQKNYCTTLSLEEKASNTTIKTNLDSLKIWDKDLEDIVKDAQNAYKMTFEQVFLVMLYVRHLLRVEEKEENSPDIEGRIKLIGTLFDGQEPKNKEGFIEVQQHVLQMLENNAGSNDVIAHLQSLKSEDSERILRNIQDHKVVFSPVKYFYIPIRRQYSYYDLYICIKKPIEIFRKLLSQQVIDKSAVQHQLFNKIKQYVDDINPSDPKVEIIRGKMSPDKKAEFLELYNKNSFSEIIEKYTPFDKNIILQDIRSELAISLGKWSSDIFALISNPFYSEEFSEIHWKHRKNFNKFFSITKDSKSVIMSLDTTPVENLHKLHQLDDLFESLKLGLIAKLDSEKRGRAESAEILINNQTALAEISAWYDRYAVGLFKKIDQIPKAIVTIIDFDLDRRDLGLNTACIDAGILKKAYSSLPNIEAELKKRPKKSPVRERNAIITYIISSNLYLNGNAKKSGYDSNFNYLLSLIECNSVQNIKDLLTLKNPIMASWTIFKENDDGSLNAEFGLEEQDRMMYRFKTIPVFFKKPAKIELNKLAQDIISQANTNDPKPFPYNSDFPWPLWIRTNQAQESKESKAIIKFSELAWTILEQSIIEVLQPLPYISKHP